MQPQEALETNFLATYALARAAAFLRVERFVLASTTQLYARSATPEATLDETSPLRPAALYTKLKRNAENALLEVRAPGFTPVVLRLGELFGLGPRFRYDRALNKLAVDAVYNGHLLVGADTHPVPLVHVREAAEAVRLALAAPAAQVARGLYNIVGPVASVLEMERLLRQRLPDTRVFYHDATPDQALAVGRVSGAQAREALGFLAKVGLSAGLDELLPALQESRRAAEAEQQGRRAAAPFAPDDLTGQARVG